MNLADLYTIAALALLTGICLLLNYHAGSRPLKIVSYVLMWAAFIGLVAAVAAPILGYDLPGVAG